MVRYNARTVDDVERAYEEDALVDGVEDALQQRHDHQLQGTDLADQTTEGDQQRSYQIQTGYESVNADRDVRPSPFVPLGEEGLSDTNMVKHFIQTHTTNILYVYKPPLKYPTAKLPQ